LALSHNKSITLLSPPSDFPGAIITAIKFDEKNYNLWEQAVRTLSKSKNKLGFIDGSITKSKRKVEDITDEERAWEIVNSMIVSWIMNVIDPRLQKNIVYVEAAFKLWENIKK